MMEEQGLRWEVRGREVMNQDKLQQNYCIKQHLIIFLGGLK